MITLNILAVDPGGTTGWANFIGPKLESFGQVKTLKEDKTEFFDWLNSVSPDIFVVENYIIRPPKAGGFDHQFSTGWTLRAIGSIMFRAHVLGIPCILQNSSIKTAASPMAYGKPYEKKANIHYWDATLHGVYYLMRDLKVARKELGVYVENEA